MRRFATVLLFLLFVGPAHAGDKRLGQLVSAGTSVNNHTTAAPFKTASPGLPKNLAIQCGVAVRVAFGEGSSTAATTTDVLIQANELYAPPRLTSDEDSIAIIPVSGSATCQVYERKF